MIERIIIAGAGGQGIMLLGKILAEAAMRENNYITWLPSYGAEVRGGAAHCMVVISDEEVGSPYINKADSLIIMNEPALERFKARGKNKGLMIINSSLVYLDIDSGRRILKHPFTDIAAKLGNIKVANMVALGCYLARKKIVNIKSVLDTIKSVAADDKKELIEINRKALYRGIDLIN